MKGQHAVGAAGDRLQERPGLGPESGEVGQQTSADRGRGIVEQTQQCFPAGGSESFRFHTAKREKNFAQRNRETCSRDK